ncbi:MAG: glycoside hydrolase family 16 protein [Dysgonamonadaceae bacterium]
MKKSNILFILLLLVLPFVACSDKKESGKWTLVWEDNFNRDGWLDTISWSKIPRGRSDWNRYMSDYESVCEVRGGNLILRGIQNTVLPNDTAPYLTGGVYTKGKRTFDFGRLEIRAKLVGAQGAHSGIWMFPADDSGIKGGEIDIMERINYDKYIYQTVHSHYTDVLGIKDKPVANSVVVTFDVDDYNVYAFEKYPDSLVFFVNSVHTKTYPRVETIEGGQFPFNDNEFYLLMAMQLGNAWAGPVDPASLPAEMYIDWVRYYQPKNEKTE